MRWIIDRCENRVDANETPIGFLPNPADIDTTDLDITAEALQALTSFDRKQWSQELIAVGEYLESYGDRLPPALREEQRMIAEALAS